MAERTTRTKRPADSPPDGAGSTRRRRPTGSGREGTSARRSSTKKAEPPRRASSAPAETPRRARTSAEGGPRRRSPGKEPDRTAGSTTPGSTTPGSTTPGSTKRDASDGSGSRLSGARLASRLKDELGELLGAPAERVIALRRDGDSWTATVEVLELSRIPETMDLLAVYQVTADRRGEIESWDRLGRYARSDSQGE